MLTPRRAAFAAAEALAPGFDCFLPVRIGVSMTGTESTERDI